MKNEDRNVGRTRNWILFTIYMLVLMYLLFFSDSYGRTTVYEDYQYNLVPFKEINLFRNLLGGKYWHLYMINVLGNIGVFIPFGFMVAHLVIRKSLLTVFVGVLFSLSIETLQLFTKVGVFDVDDIILNTIGVILGVIFWKIDMVRAKKDKY